MAGDPLGGCEITANGIVKRDLIVWETCFRNKVPILMVTSGGYQKTNGRVIADSVKNLQEKLHILEVAKANYENSFCPHHGGLVFEEVRDEMKDDEEEEGEDDDEEEENPLIPPPPDSVIKQHKPGPMMTRRRFNTDGEEKKKKKKKKGNDKRTGRKRSRENTNEEDDDEEEKKRKKKKRKID